MQLATDPPEGIDFEAETPAHDQPIDFTALRILATWIAQHSGVDPGLGATIERGFVVAQAHA